MENALNLALLGSNQGHRDYNWLTINKLLPIGRALHLIKIIFNLGAPCKVSTHRSTCFLARDSRRINGFCAFPELAVFSLPSFLDTLHMP